LPIAECLPHSVFHDSTLKINCLPFFDSEAVTSEEKLRFIEELATWFESRRQVFADRAEAQEKAEQK
jgi:hypothetical protein